MVMRAITRTFKRLAGMKDASDAVSIKNLILGDLKQGMGVFCGILRLAKCGNDTLEEKTCQNLHTSLMANVFQLGVDHKQGYIVLPQGCVLGRTSQQEEIIISIADNEDLFFLRLYLNDQDDLYCHAGWKKQPDLTDWPDSADVLKKFHTKITGVIELLRTLI